MNIDQIASATFIPGGAYVAAGVPQPLLRDRSTMRVSLRAIGAGVEAGSIGARTATLNRRQDLPGLDVDITACYPNAAALSGIQDFLTHEVTAHDVKGTRALARLSACILDAVDGDLLRHPKLWRDLAFLVKVRPDGDVLTLPVELFGTQATLTAPIFVGTEAIWVSGYDLALALVEDLDAGGPGRLPEIVEAWTFEFGARLRGLRSVGFPGGWTWDPRRASTYRSKDGRTWGNLYLLLAAMRIATRSDPELSAAARGRRGVVLKTAAVAAAFGMFIATTVRPDHVAGTPHRVITSDGIRTTDRGRAERPGPWAFPPAAALVQGAGRLLLTLLMHEARVRGGAFMQVDTDGGFIFATPEGGQSDEEMT